MLKAYEFRLYPNLEQQNQIARTFGCVRFVYNYYLEKSADMYKTQKKRMTKTECNNDLNRQLKEKYPWLREVDKFALTNAVYNLDAAFQKFFHECAGYPIRKKGAETGRSSESG